MYGIFIAFSEEVCFYQDPVTCQELFFQSHDSLPQMA